jgi:type IV pilus assembly protein PilW
VNARGVTLIELMIALALRAIVSLGAVQLFDATQRSARLGEGQARVQENGRFALAFLREAVRSAGLAPCTGRAPTLRSTLRGGAGDQPPPRFALRAALGGYDGGRQGFAPALTGNDLGLEETHLRDGSDVLVVRGFQGKGLRLVSEISQPSAVLFTETPADPTLFASGAVLLLSDCRRGTIFQLQSAGTTEQGFRLTRSQGVNPSPGNFTADLYFDGSPFSTGATVRAVSVRSFFIAPGVGENNRGDAPPTLYRKGAGAAEALVEGVEDLQLRFAVDQDGDGVPEQYLSAGFVPDFAAVRAVELAVLATSVDVVSDEGDGILRQRFTQVVALRNRAP